MMKKTKLEMFEQILSHTTDSAERSFLAHEVELLENKAARSKNATHRLTKTQVENLNLQNEIYEFVKENPNCTIAEVRKQFDISSQKATPLLNDMVAKGNLVKVVTKKVAHYSTAE